MTPNELTRRLRRLARERGLDLTIEPGKGSHMHVTLGGRRTVIAIHAGDIKPGTIRAIMRQLGINERDL